MSESQQITYMQARIIRLAMKKWGLPLIAVVSLFKQYEVLQFIRECFPIFHLEGDEAVFEDVIKYPDAKGWGNDKRVS